MATPTVRRPHIDDGFLVGGTVLKTCTVPPPRPEACRLVGLDFDAEAGDAGEVTARLLTIDKAVLLATWLLQRAEECRR